MAKKEMSAFEKAFAAARKEKGSNATFEFNGKKYTTARADDKPAPKGVAREIDRPDYFPSGNTVAYNKSAKMEEPPKAPAKDLGKAASWEKEDEKMARAQRLVRAASAMRRGGSVKKYAAGGSVGSASKRADGCAMKGKTKGRFV
jgi:hypothetical protein